MATGPRARYDVYAVSHPTAMKLGTHWMIVVAQAGQSWRAGPSQVVTNTNSGHRALVAGIAAKPINMLGRLLGNANLIGEHFTIQLRSWEEHLHPSNGNVRAACSHAQIIASNVCVSADDIFREMNLQLCNEAYGPGKTCKCIVTRTVKAFLSQGFKDASYCCLFFPDCPC